VDRFQSSPDIPLFLLSLKAGGTGLNLTGADTVVHFDPWWNPAAEAQATDRAHRIGQARVVTSYKLIAASTVEEKVLALQAEKRALLAGVFEASDAAAAKLSLGDLRELLKA
jgi:SNF2 family DNA or RNA helicase